MSPLYKTDDPSLVCNCRPKRYKHKMSLFYKMITDATPTLLRSLLPQTVENTPLYNLRDSQNIMPLLTRTKLYYNLFYSHALENRMEFFLEFESQPLSKVLNNSLTKTILRYQFITVQATYCYKYIILG